MVSDQLWQREPDVVRSMLQSIAHRGPDEEGLLADTVATIGARRLSIVDVADGHQPMTNESGDVAAVQNGEIYNYQELKQELAAAGHRFRTRSDTEVLPHAYEAWGPDFVRRLEGMFAIALWDRSRRLLLLARDRFGEKPLAYAPLDGTLVFASEIQALLRHPNVGRVLDDTAIAEYLSLGYVRAPGCAFAAIRKVPPSHLLLFRDGRCDLQRYWSLPFGPKLRIAPEEAGEETRRLIDQAVRARLMSDVPLGAFLSGGLDSSTVVAFMSRHSNRPVKTFSVGFGNEGRSELTFARAAARAFGTDHHEFIVDAQDVSALTKLVRNLGEPFADPSIIPTYHVARIAGAEVTVSLSGDGGDELFGGYDRYKAAAMMSALDRLPAFSLRAVARLGRRIPESLLGPSLRRILSGIQLSADERHLRWSSHYTGEAWRRLLGDRVAGRMARGAAGQLGQAAAITSATDPVEQYMASDTLGYLPDYLLVKVDIATMANSLESRAPFLDHKLAEFVARLPREYKVSAFGTKRLLRRAMRGILPERILNRGKMGFTPPVAAWLRGPLRDSLQDCVEFSVAAERGYLKPEGLRQLFREHDSGLDRGLLLWSVLMLELWLREYARAPVH